MGVKHPKGRSSRFTDDEKINMQVRYEAGEKASSIAEDYDCHANTVRSYVSDTVKATRLKQARERVLNRNKDRNAARTKARLLAKRTKLRKKFLTLYLATGGNLLADLAEDAGLCLSHQNN